MVVNDYVYRLVHRSALESIASKLAPTVDRGVAKKNARISQCGHFRLGLRQAY